MSALSPLVAMAWRWATAPATRRYGRACRHPERIQRALLSHLLRANAGTLFARDHGLAPHLLYEDFRQRVPLREPAEYEPWLNAVARGERGVLTSEPVRALVPTSGTEAGQKLIPWTDRLGLEFRAAIDPWIAGFMRDCPDAWSGRAYWSVSPPVWRAKRSSGGLPVGFASDSAYLAPTLARLVDATLAVPPEVSLIAEPLAWQYLTLAFLLRSSDLSLVSIWSPTFLLALMDRLPIWWDRLLADLEVGTLCPPVATEIPHRLAARWRRHPARARELARLGSHPETGRLWPHLAAISCWVDAAASAPARRLADAFPRARVVGKGLLATEGAVSLPVSGAAAPTLALASHVLEFVDERGDVHPAWELVEDAEYEVVLTTGGGLYRYRLGDRIRVVGFLSACPQVVFVGRKGDGCDLCGEKLEESFVRHCLQQLGGREGVPWGFAMLAPDGGTGGPGYTLYLASDKADLPVQNIVRQLDIRLQDNVHYAHARRLGQLAPVRGYLLRGGGQRAWRRYQERMVADGFGAGSIKPTALSRSTGWQAAFACAEDGTC